MSDTQAEYGASAPSPTTSPATMADGIPVPEDLDEAELAITQAPGAEVRERITGPAAPTLDPPGSPGAARADQAVGAFPAVRVLSLFSSAHPVNGWAFLEGVGWRRLAVNDPSAHANLGRLAAAARLQGTATPVRHETDNQIHEIYLW